MIANIDEFVDTLRKWLDDSSILADTRRFLESGQGDKLPGAITDSQRANWRRKGRGLPGAFVQGAALCYRAQPGTAQPSAAHRCAIEGGPFWQLMIVHALDRVDQEMMDCSILRLWHGLRTIRRSAEWFAHTALRSTEKSDENSKKAEPPVEEDCPGTGKTDGWLGDPKEWPEKVEPLVEDDSFRPHGDGAVVRGDGYVVPSWAVGREPRDQGYAVHFRAAITNHRVEAVGGYPHVPVTSGHLLAYLPRSALDRKLPSNPRGVPTAFSAFLHGDPAGQMEEYLGIHKSPSEKDFRRIAAWYNEGPQVAEWSQGVDGVPKLIRQHAFFEHAEDCVRRGTHQAFVTHINSPDPFLSHFMVFGSRRQAIKEGVSDG